MVFGRQRPIRHWTKDAVLDKIERTGPGWLSSNLDNLSDEKAAQLMDPMLDEEQSQ